MRVLIAGCGQIGYRYFQAISRYEKISSVVLYDPVEPSWKAEYSRCISEVCWVNSLRSAVGNTFDVVVVSTRADVRFEVVSDLISIFKIKYLILEKFLFLDRDEYCRAQTLFSNSGVEVFVNEWPVACDWLRNAVIAAQNIYENETLIIRVEGYRWGLLSNAVHFLGLLKSVLNLKAPIFVLEGCFECLYESGREGFSDICGRLSFKCGSVQLHLESNDPQDGVYDWTDDLTFTLSGDNEVLGKILIERDRSIVISEEREIFGGVGLMSPFYLSEYFSSVLDNLLDTGTCKLARYSESSLGHLAVIEALETIRNECNLNPIRFT